MASNPSLQEALDVFVKTVALKMTAPTVGAPEEQLRGPCEVLFGAFGVISRAKIVCVGNTTLSSGVGIPDFAVHTNGVLTGFIELKAPGLGADTSKFKGRNRQQWDRYRSLPNILYSDGNEWALYRHGERVTDILRLSTDISRRSSLGATAKDVKSLTSLLSAFVAWEPIIPATRKGQIDFSGLAGVLAPLCRLLRDDIADALSDPSSPFVRLAADWRQLLFPQATDEQFADAYAQTVIFALLLGRSEGADPLTVNSAKAVLAAQHSLLSRALEVLTGGDGGGSVALALIQRHISAISIAGLRAKHDPWLYFYEDFLASYDPDLRKDAGAYYTPLPIVRAQVRIVDDLLHTRFGKRHGFADDGVITLDPASGTGTYLLGIVEHALEKVRLSEGAGSVPGRATTLAKNLHGFEIMVGPYAVAELRLSRALKDKDGKLPKDGVRVFLTDTLESPNAPTPHVPVYLEPIAEQHLRALKVKKSTPVVVCIGNPPYDRHAGVHGDDSGHLSGKGGWVRFGDLLPEARLDSEGDGKRRTLPTKRTLAERAKHAILQSFIKPVVDSGNGRHIKNLYNLYIYFWRWALWKVFEQNKSRGAGVVSFITAASYLDGPAFAGMREHMRRVCDDIWIIDLGGDARASTKEENVFAILTPVAIGIALSGEGPKQTGPANVWYTRVDGRSEDKLAALDQVYNLDAFMWEACETEWQAPFRPSGRGEFFTWPLLTDIMPWQHSGVQAKRTWPIAPLEAVLSQRWEALLRNPSRTEAFRETPDRKITGRYGPEGSKLPSIEDLSPKTPCPDVRRYGYRSFDRQYILWDVRVLDRMRPDLAATQSNRQLYLSSALSGGVGRGPALTVSAYLPDLHFFSGRGAKDILPLYRDGSGVETNVNAALVGLLSDTYQQQVTPEEVVAYVYGLLAQPAYTERFGEELRSKEIRVPLTDNADLFAKVRDRGHFLLWLHTYGERCNDAPGAGKGIPRGSVRCVVPVSENEGDYPQSFEYDDKGERLLIGNGVFEPVARSLYEYEVSGFKVVQSWLECRIGRRGKKKSSQLDDIACSQWTSQVTTELLELLWVLEKTQEEYAHLAKLLAEVASGGCIKEDKVPRPANHYSLAPVADEQPDLF